MYSLWEDLSHGTVILYLDLEVWPTFEKLYPLLLFSDGCRPASVVVFWQLLFLDVVSTPAVQLTEAESFHPVGMFIAWNVSLITAKQTRPFGYTKRDDCNTSFYLDLQSLDPAAVWSRVSHAGPACIVGCHICWWHRIWTGWLYLRVYAAVHQRPVYVITIYYHYNLHWMSWTSRLRIIYKNQSHLYWLT